MVLRIKKAAICVAIAALQIILLCACGVPESEVTTTKKPFVPVTPTAEQIADKTQYFYYEADPPRMTLTDDFSLFEKMFENEPNEKVAVMVFFYKDVNTQKGAYDYSVLIDYGFESFIDGCEDGYFESGGSASTFVMFRNYRTFLMYYDVLLSMTADDRVQKLQFWMDPYSEKYNVDDDTIDE